MGRQAYLDKSYGAHSCANGLLALREVLNLTPMQQEHPVTVALTYGLHPAFTYDCNNVPATMLALREAVLD